MELYATRQHMETQKNSGGTRPYNQTEKKMVFLSPAWVPGPLPPIPDVSLWEFMLDERHGRVSIEKSLPSYVCGLSGRKVFVKEQARDAELLARTLAQETGWEVNNGSSLDKVVCIFAQNTASLSMGYKRSECAC